MTIPASGRARHLLPATAHVAALALLLIVYLTLWLAIFQQSALQGVDFLIFYTAGRIARAGELARLYDLDLQHRFQTGIVAADFVRGGPLPYNHPPFFAPLLGLVAVDDYHTSYALWCGILLLVLLGCAALAYRWLRESGWSAPPALLAATGALLFYPIFISVLKGQDTAFVLLGALLWARGIVRRDDRTAGLALALMALRPQIALALALPLLLARPRAFAWFAGGCAALGAWSLALIGPSGALAYIDVLRRSAGAEGLGINQAAMVNLTGAALQIAPNLDAGPRSLLGWGGFVAASAVIAALWWRRRARLTARDAGLALLAALFCSPHLHYHDLSLLLVPALALIERLAARPGWSQEWAAALIPAASVLLLLGHTSTPPWPVASAVLLTLATSAALLLVDRGARAAEAGAP